MIQDILKDHIAYAVQVNGVNAPDVHIEHPAELMHGDFSTNVAMKYAKECEQNPREFAEKIVSVLQQYKDDLFIDRIEVAGPGFINIYLSRSFFTKTIKDIRIHQNVFGANERLEGKNVMVEYTDPNPFKEFHAGHIMANTVGETVARLYEWQGARVTRVCYQGDIGPHVAKALYGMKEMCDSMPSDSASLDEKIAFVGKAYVFGTQAYENDVHVAEVIDSINKAIYFGRMDSDSKSLYEWGRSVSLEHFEEMYKKLGTSFDRYYFESNTFQKGMELVEEGKQKNMFEDSDGAIVFRGEQYGLHTRVFVTSLGLPTYETKDLGLAYVKFQDMTVDNSVVITANEQTAYFQVVQKVLEQLNSVYAEKTRHITHGILRTPEGKMSSRTGNVLGGGTIVTDAENRARNKIRETNRDLDNPDQLATDEAVAAIKYAILKQVPGKDVTFDIEQSLSLEGDSGPYLQYTHTRCVSILEQAEQKGLEPDVSYIPDELYEIERILYRFPEVVAVSFDEMAPQQLVGFITHVASQFNTLYGTETLVDEKDVYSPYKLAITEAVRIVIKNGLSVLGIRAPEKM